MSAKSWEVWSEWFDHLGSFRTFAAAEKSARRRVVQNGERLEIRENGGRLIAYVRRDPLDRVWTDVVDCEVA